MYLTAPWVLSMELELVLALVGFPWNRRIPYFFPIGDFFFQYILSPYLYVSDSDSSIEKIVVGDSVFLKIHRVVLPTHFSLTVLSIDEKNFRPFFLFSPLFQKVF